MDKLNQSLNELKEKLKQNEELTSEEWNKYAHENSYYSSTTLEAHINVKNWSELKKVYHKNIEKNLSRQIEIARQNLDKSIKETGLHSENTRIVKSD